MKQKIQRSIEFMEFVLSNAETYEDIEWCLDHLFELNKLLSMTSEN